MANLLFKSSDQCSEYYVLYTVSEEHVSLGREAPFCMTGLDERVLEIPERGIFI